MEISIETWRATLRRSRVHRHIPQTVDWSIGLLPFSVQQLREHLTDNVWIRLALGKLHHLTL
jgi:hypothetical protein